MNLESTLFVAILPAREDNYIFIVVNSQTLEALVVDPTEADPVLITCKQKGWDLKGVLCTHHHNDHINGIQKILSEWSHSDLPVYCHADDQSRIPPANRFLYLPANLELLGFEWQAIHVPGHTKNHVAYFVCEEDKFAHLFSGDVLFGCGCGKLFEGTAKDLLQSLEIIRALPEDTLIYCSHEYTVKNSEIFHMFFPEDRHIYEYLKTKKQMRSDNRTTVPLSLKEEKCANPFLRWDDLQIQNALDLSDSLKIVKKLREMRDLF